MGRRKSSGKETRERSNNYVDDEFLGNKDFEDYYKQQNILNENDFALFLESLRQPLPINFRITGSRKHAADLLDYMKKEVFSDIEDALIEGVPVPKPQSLPWYPNQLAWQLDVGRTAMRKSPEIKKLQNFLVAETEIGNVSRQEAVSMLPPLFLDVQPGHIVLDMCAAPGSKTAQLLEAVTGGENDASFPSGLVIANDSDQKRAYLLVHQAKRLQSPCLLVTNHEGQEFPKIVVKQNEESSKLSVMQFDRILCDVPCSGDGTLRKNKTIFRTWMNTQGNGLHPVQLSILKRGCVLLKKGGIIVYSTCSFNPVENEAVVAAILNETNGAFELMDVSLPGLIKMPGMIKWKVKKNGKYYDGFEKDAGLSESMFPPSNISSLNMERCIRVYPQMQNTGGFFIAVLKKVADYGVVDTGKIPKEKKPTYQHSQKRPLSSSNEAEEAVNEDELDGSVAIKKKKATITNSHDHDEPQLLDKQIINAAAMDDVSPMKKKKKVGWGGLNEEPFVFLKPDNGTLHECLFQYGLGDHPAVPKDSFLVRCAEEKNDYRHIYMVSKAAKQVLTSRNAESIKVVNTGVKAFTRIGGTKANGFRICNDASQSLSLFIPDEKLVHIPIADLITITSIEYPLFTMLSVEGQNAMASLEYGSYVLFVDPTIDGNYRGSVTSPIYAPFLRSHTSVNLLLDKAERKSLLVRLNGQNLSIEYGELNMRRKQEKIE